MKDILQSKTIRGTLWVVGAIIVLLLVFGLGTLVGYHRAMFASGFGANYYRNFNPAPRGLAGPEGQMSFSMHGVAGTVLDVASTTLSVEDQSGNEQSVLVTSGTAIREMSDVIIISNIQAGDTITVIGDPNQSGQIEARFIRVFGASSSMQMPPPPANVTTN